MVELALRGHSGGGEIERRFRAARDTAERAHWRVVWLAGSGHSGGAVARITGLTDGRVGSVVRRYNEPGPDSLGDRRRRNRGARPLLDAEGEEELRAALAARPPDGGLWAGPKSLPSGSTRGWRRGWAPGSAARSGRSGGGTT